MIEQIFSISSAIVMLGVLIFVHELGHFLFAKYFRVGVVEFAIGFGKVLVSKQFGETRYTIRAVPLGGFVKMVGEDPLQGEEGEEDGNTDNAAEDAADDNDVESKAANHGAETTKAGSGNPPANPLILAAMKDESRWFSRKPLYQRALVVFAGPLFNFLFAAFCGFLMLAFYGAAVHVNDPVVGIVFEDQPAARAGLVDGDRILTVDGRDIAVWEEFASSVWGSEGRELLLGVQRGAEVFEVSVTPVSERTEIDVVFGDSQAEPPYRIGVGPSTARVPISIGAAALGGVEQTYVWSGMILRGLYAMVTGQISTKNIGGPIQIVQHAAQSTQAGGERVLSFLLFLSVSLAVLNLLPIPVLDGGHLFFFFIEAVRRKPISIKTQLVAQQLGMVALILLMVFAISNDVHRVFLS